MSTIRRPRGDTYPEQMTITDDFVPINITGATVVMTIKYTTPVLVTADIVDAPTGKVEFPFLPSEVAVSGEYRYDVQVTYADGSIATHAIDDFILEEDVTK